MRRALILALVGVAAAGPAEALVQQHRIWKDRVEARWPEERIRERFELHVQTSGEDVVVELTIPPAWSEEVLHVVIRDKNMVGSLSNEPARGYDGIVYDVDYYEILTGKERTADGAVYRHTLPALITPGCYLEIRYRANGYGGDYFLIDLESYYEYIAVMRKADVQIVSVMLDVAVG